VKVVYVVLEAQYQSALTKAVLNINAKRSNVSCLLQSDCLQLVAGQKFKSEQQSLGESGEK